MDASTALVELLLVPSHRSLVAVSTCCLAIRRKKGNSDLFLLLAGLQGPLAPTPPPPPPPPHTHMRESSRAISYLGIVGVAHERLLHAIVRGVASSTSVWYLFGAAWAESYAQVSDAHCLIPRNAHQSGHEDNGKTRRGTIEVAAKHSWRVLCQIVCRLLALLCVCWCDCVFDRIIDRLTDSLIV